MSHEPCLQGTDHLSPKNGDTTHFGDVIEFPLLSTNVASRFTSERRTLLRRWTYDCCTANAPLGLAGLPLSPQVRPHSQAR